MQLLKKIPKALALSVLLLITLALDYLMYSFLLACPSCANFSQFITTQASLSAPLITSLSVLFSLTGKQK